MPANVCAEFKLFPDDTPLGPNFSLAGFIFSQIPGSAPMFVNETSGEKGVQFPDQGMSVSLPQMLTDVRFRLGTFAGAVTVQGLDSMGQIVAQQSIPGLNQYGDYHLAGPGITVVRFSGGGNEGILTSICVVLCSC